MSGPLGVVATDIDLRFLDRIRVSSLEIRRHDIVKDELESGVYVLVHCRKLLVHLRGPEKDVKKRADAQRLGGWILVEEDDYGSVLSMDVTDRFLTPPVALIRGIHESLRKKGIVNLYFGRRVRGLVEGAGFVDVGQEG